MSLPTNWATMSSTSAIGIKEVVVSGFTFHVLPFGTNVNQLISSGIDSEKINISYRIIDKTDYGATVNPKTTYGSGYGLALYDALRKLAYDPSFAPLSSGIYRVGSWITFGTMMFRVMNAVFSLENEKNPDVFVLTLECSVTYGGSRDKDYSNKAERKIKPSFRDAPWNLPPKITIDHSTEDFVNGFAYSNKEVLTLKPDGKITPENVKQKTMFDKSQLTSVVNSAGEPFLSPVGQKVSVAKINIDASFTKDNVPTLPPDISNQINAGDISITYNGAVLLHCSAGTLVLSGWVVSPEVWTQNIPWFPKEKHPLGFTYGDLYQSVSSRFASKPAINETNGTIMVEKEYGYFSTRATFSYCASGFGSLVPNRGKNYIDKGKLKPISKLEMGRAEECFLDKSGGALKDGKTLTFIGYSPYYTGNAVASFLNTLLSKNTTSVTWATKRDK